MMVSIEDILEAIPFGRMQYFIVIFHFLMFVTTSFLVYNYCFFLMFPQYKCMFNDPTSGLPKEGFETCTKEDICGISPLSSYLNKWEVDYSSRFSLNNWLSLLDMHCSSSLEIGLFGTLFFAGYLVSCAVFPPMADKYGRKIFTIAVCVIQTICFALMIFVPNLLLYYVMNTILGASVPLKGMIAYTHMMEWVHGKEPLVSGILFCYDAFIFVLSPLVLLYLTVNT